MTLKARWVVVFTLLAFSALCLSHSIGSVTKSLFAESKRLDLSRFRFIGNSSGHFFNRFSGLIGSETALPSFVGAKVL